MFRASAHRYSSATRELRIRNGGLGNDASCSRMLFQVPGSESHSQTTMGILFRDRTASDEASVPLLYSVHFESGQSVHWELFRTPSKKAWSASIGLTERTTKVSVAP